MFLLLFGLAPDLHFRPLLYCSLAILLPLASVRAVAQTDVGAVIPADEPVRVVAIGDFGTGSKEEGRVVQAIAAENKDKPFQLGLTLGDNFYYCGVSGVDDKLWITVWERFFGPLKIPFYPTFGNHDYGRGAGPLCAGRKTRPEAEIEYSKHNETWRMPAAYYRFAAGPAEFFALDTENWTEGELKWLEHSLEQSSSGIKWRVVYGHHPIFSSGRHQKDARIRQLQSDLLPVLKAGRVDAYIAGHDHDMEHLEVQGIHLFVAGGGGASTYNLSHRSRYSLFAIRDHGFLELEADAQSLHIRLLDADRKLLGEPFSKTR